MKIRDMSNELRWMMLGTIIANVSSTMYAPFLPLYLESLGAVVAMIGVFFTFNRIFVIVFRPIGGWISDHFGRLPTMAIGGVFGLASVFVYAIAPTWEWALLGALFSGMGSSLVGPSFQAYIAENAPEGATGSTFGLMESLFMICQIIGPLLGGFLAETVSFRVLMFVGTGITLIATLVRIWIAYGKPLPVRELKFASLKHDLRAATVLLLGGGFIVWLIVIEGIFQAGSEAVNPFLPTYATDIGGVSETVYGGFVALMSAVAALLSWLGGNFSDRYGEHISFAVGAFACGAGFLLMLLLPTTIGFIGGFTLMGLSMVFMRPAASALVSKTVPRHQLGLMYGVFNTAMGALAIPTPSIGGQLYETVSPRATLLLGVVLSFITIPLALWKLRVPTAKSKRTTDTVPVTSSGD